MEMMLVYLQNKYGIFAGKELSKNIRAQMYSFDVEVN